MVNNRGYEDNSSALIKHKAAVSVVSGQIAHFHTRKIPFRIFHGNTNSTRPSVRTRDATVDISSLNNVVTVSPSKRTCLVEPNVSMDALVAATVRHGLIPPVIPEFPGITVGGGYAGTAGESSSFKYGFFDSSVVRIEIILADGEALTASANEREDLFRGTAGTFGTLGVTTLFEIRLIPTKEFVELSYLPVKNIEHAQKVMRSVAAEDNMDFLDGIMFSPDKGVIMAGRFAARNEKNRSLPVVMFTKPWDQWFYIHAESQINIPSTTARRDLIPLQDYLFRYDRGAFWTARHAYTYFLTPFTRLTRYLLDPLMHTRTMYHALHRSGLMQRFIIQDMAVPNKNIPEFSQYLDTELPHIYPRWLCPLKQHESVSMHPHSTPAASSPDDVLLNIGLWGPTPSDTTQLAANRRIEAKLKSLGGMKWLYAQTFYTEDEFWTIYDRRWYEALRKKYKAEGLPSVYEKVRTQVDVDELGRMGIERGFWSVWPFAGVYGVLSVLKGGDYLRKS